MQGLFDYPIRESNIMSYAGNFLSKLSLENSWSTYMLINASRKEQYCSDVLQWKKTSQQIEVPVLTNWSSGVTELLGTCHSKALYKESIAKGATKRTFVYHEQLERFKNDISLGLKYLGNSLVLSDDVKPIP